MAPEQPTKVGGQSTEIDPFRRAADEQDARGGGMGGAGVRVAVPEHASQRQATDDELVAVVLGEETLGAGA